MFILAVGSAVGCSTLVMGAAGVGELWGGAPLASISAMMVLAMVCLLPGFGVIGIIGSGGNGAIGVGRTGGVAGLHACGVCAGCDPVLPLLGVIGDMDLVEGVVGV